MSNEVTIEQMNDVIAVFDGWGKRPERIIDPEKTPFYYLKHGFTYRWISDFNYHSSWDALMPCWDKFRNNVSDHFDEDFPPEYCAMCDAWALYCEHVNINGAHGIIYDGIQWFNKQQSNERQSQQNRQ